MKYNNSNFIKKKNAQVTIFLILAIIIVLLGASFFYFKSILQKEEKVEPELVPVKTFIDSCIDTTAKKGLDIIGQTGGYAYIPQDIANNPRSYLAIGPNAFFKSPYWWYEGVSNVPSEDLIKDQIEKYVYQNLRSCFNNFTVFNNEYIVKELDDLKVEAQIINKKVKINIEYPVEVSYNLGKTRLKIKKFSRLVPVKLKSMHTLAKKIIEQENFDFFVEKKTIDLMTMNRNIPTTDVEGTCEERVWEFSEVKKLLKELIAANIPYIKVRNTKYSENMFVPTPDGKNKFKDSYYNHHYIWDVGSQNQKDISVSFTYDPNWYFDMDARPRDGRYLRSNSMKGSDMISWLCIHIWHFTYDVKYPVRVTITDHENDYSFSFPFMVSIDHNMPKKETFSHKIFTNDEGGSEKEYCQSSDNLITILLEEDSLNSLEIEGAELSFTCGRYTCSMGESEYISGGAAAGITAKMPYCVNGILRAKKEGYLDSEMFIQTDYPGTFTMKMTPLKEFRSYKVIKHPIVYQSDNDELKETEKATIHIKAKDADFETFGMYPESKDSPLKLLGDKEHTYDVSIFIVEGDELVGGYKSEWKVAQEDLIDSSLLTFHALDFGFTTDKEMFDYMSKLKDYSKDLQKPQIS